MMRVAVLPVEKSSGTRCRRCVVCLLREEGGKSAVDRGPSVATDEEVNSFVSRLPLGAT